MSETSFGSGCLQPGRDVVDVRGGADVVELQKVIMSLSKKRKGKSERGEI